MARTAENGAARHLPDKAYAAVVKELRFIDRTFTDYTAAGFWIR